MRTLTLTDTNWRQLKELMQNPIYRSETPELEELRKNVFNACQIAERKDNYHD